MDPADSSAAYRWVEDDPGFDAFCVSVLLGVSEDEVAEAFAVDRATRRLATFAEQGEMGVPYPEGYGNDTVQIDALGNAVVCIESNGWAGVEGDRARRLPAGGSMVAVYRNVNALMQFMYARQGEIVRSFDPLLYDPAGALDQEAGLPFGHPGSPTAAAFALMEGLTGIPLTRHWLIERAHPAYRRAPTS